MPPSPICSISLYGPITVPGCSESPGFSEQAAVNAPVRQERWPFQETSGITMDPEHVLHLAPELGITTARCKDVRIPLVGRQFAHGVQEKLAGLIPSRAWWHATPGSLPIVRIGGPIRPEK